MSVYKLVQCTECVGFAFSGRRVRCLYGKWNQVLYSVPVEQWERHCRETGTSPLGAQALTSAAAGDEASNEINHSHNVLSTRTVK